MRRVKFVKLHIIRCVRILCSIKRQLTQTLKCNVHIQIFENGLDHICHFYRFRQLSLPSVMCYLKTRSTKSNQI